MGEFESLIRLQLGVGLALILLGFGGLFVLFAMLWPGCAPSNRAMDERNRLDHQEEIQRRHAERCEEMLVEGDVESMREWCQSSLMRETSRRHACEMVENYDRFCSDEQN